MFNDDININETILSGVINSITDTNDEYVKFGLTCLKFNNDKYKNVYVSLNINRDLYNCYKDLFVKQNKIFIKGYHNSYKDKNNKIQSFITVTNVSNNYDEIMLGRKAPHIRYDPDGVMVWNGKRCETIPPTEEELKEMEDLLKEFK